MRYPGLIWGGILLFIGACGQILIPDVDAYHEIEPGAGGNPGSGWARGIGSAMNDERAFDVALGPTPDSVVATVWFNQSTIGIDPVGTFTATGAADVLLVNFTVSDGFAKWASHIKCTGGVIRSVVESDANGNTVVAGGFNGVMTVDGLAPSPAASNYDAYFAKFDSAGNPLWLQTFGEVHHQLISDVAVDGEGNIIVVGVTEGGPYKFGTTIAGVDNVPSPVDTANPNKDDLFVAKYDPDGKIIWARRFGIAGNRDDGPQLGDWRDPVITVAASRTDGSILVGGAFSEVATFGATKVSASGVDDGFVTKLDANGNTLWHVTFGDTNSVQRVRSVAFASANDVVLTGSFQGTIDIDGVELKSYQNSADVLVAKLTSDGKMGWAKGYGLSGRQQGTTVLVDANDQPVVFGTFVGAIDFTKNGGIIIDSSAGKEVDIFMAKFSPSGVPSWARQFHDVDSVGGNYLDMGGATLAKDGDKNVAIVCGMNNSSMNLAPLPPLKSAGYEDAFLMSVTY